MPLVPDATVVVAEVAVLEFHVGLVILKDMTHPAPAVQSMGAPVTALAVTLKNIRSVVPL
jgi:hypothetical protein